MLSFFGNFDSQCDRFSDATNIYVFTNIEKIISEMFLCLTSWLTSRTNVFLTDPELATKIFQVVEFGLIGKLVSNSL